MYNIVLMLNKHSELSVIEKCTLFFLGGGGYNIGYTPVYTRYIENAEGTTI